MGKLALRRLTAWAIDWLLILAWVGVTAAVGVPLYAAGITEAMSPLVLNGVASVVVVVPTVIGLAWAEASSRQATPGKRLRQLRVVGTATGGGVTFRRALLRNALKIGVPWTIGHAAVIAIVESANGSVAGSVWALTAAAYVLPLFYVASLFVRDGRTPYERVARTRVVAVDQPQLSQARPGSARRR